MNLHLRKIFVSIVNYDILTKDIKRMCLLTTNFVCIDTKMVEYRKKERKQFCRYYDLASFRAYFKPP